MTFRSLHRLALPLLISTPLALTACGDDDDKNGASGEGQVTVTLYGEAFIESGIPADATADGWAVDFDRFEVTVDQATVAGVTLTVGASQDIAPATDGAGHALGQITVPAGSHQGSSFTISRVSLAGSATREGITKTFDWVFEGTTEYSDCETTTEVAANGEAVFEITMHADHFLFDSLVSDDPRVGFQALADADADDDGVITQAELAATDIGGFDPGSAGGIEDLWAWLNAHSQLLGHVDGEGHCDARRLDR